VELRRKEELGVGKGINVFMSSELSGPTIYVYDNVKINLQDVIRGGSRKFIRGGYTIKMGVYFESQYVVGSKHRGCEAAEKLHKAQKDSHFQSSVRVLVLVATLHSLLLPTASTSVPCTVW